MKKILLLCLALTLSSCMTTPAKAPARNEQISWSARSAKLAKIASWTLKGGIAVKKAEKGFSASVIWEHSPSQYQLQFFGPLGGGHVKLVGTAEQVTLTTSDNKQRTAPSAQALFSAQSGWDLPLDNLKYWIRSLPVPGVASTKQFDQFHHLTQLIQSGWTIRFQRYTQVKGFDLPSKMTLAKDDMRLRIVINSWQIG